MAKELLAWPIGWFLASGPVARSIKCVADTETSAETIWISLYFVNAVQTEVPAILSHIGVRNSLRMASIARLLAALSFVASGPVTKPLRGMTPTFCAITVIFGIRALLGLLGIRISALI